MELFFWSSKQSWAAVWAFGATVGLAVGQGRFSYSVALSGLNERPVPATPSLATGTAQITLEIFPSFTTVAWTVRWANLSGLPTAGHFHGSADPESSGPVLFPLGIFFSDSTALAGGYAGFRQLRDPAQIGAIWDGLGYIHLHTASYPEGEIRGQLQAIPEPPPMVLLGIGAALGAVAVATRLRPSGAPIEGKRHG